MADGTFTADHDLGASQLPEATNRRRDGGSSSEDHWSVVLKKLAPQGYQKSPPWQQEIIERVVKQMTARQKSARSTEGLSKEVCADEPPEALFNGSGVMGCLWTVSPPKSGGSGAAISGRVPACCSHGLSPLVR